MYNSKTVEDLFKPLLDKRKMNNAGHGIVICGHRGGAKNIHIDNTMAAFKYAIENGLEMIEFDVSEITQITYIPNIFQFEILFYFLF